MPWRTRFPLYQKPFGNRITSSLFTRIKNWAPSKTPGDLQIKSYLEQAREDPLFQELENDSENYIFAGTGTYEDWVVELDESGEEIQRTGEYVSGDLGLTTVDWD